MTSNAERGADVEQWVAAEYDVEHAPDETDWYDCIDRERGTKYEVKSCRRRVRRGAFRFVDGRFIVRERQLRSLVASDRAGTAWLVFVLRNRDDDVVDHRRVTPAVVAAVIDERGGWNDSGHEEYDREHKLPWTEVFDE